jgi:pimeloyl-ACP methyl ester carboxylesterase
LLLINGIGASLEALEPFVTALDGAVEVIRFDPPGVGGSPLPPGPYRFTGLCRLIAGMLTELGHDQADVLGIWRGGPSRSTSPRSSGTGAAGWCWSRPRRARR